jgi:hypothetical protein
MHALELHRLLKTIRNDDGFVVVEPSDLRTRATYRMDIGLQLALEIILEDLDLRERIRDEPEFQRLALDALLYPSRAWREGRMELDMGDSQLPEFRAYMLRRMNRSEATRAVERRAASAAMGTRSRAASEGVESGDVRILWTKVQQYVELLSQHGDLEGRFREWNAARRRNGRPPVDRAVLEPLLGANSSLLIKAPGGVPRYEWRYNRYGVDVAMQRAGGMPGLAQPGVAQPGLAPPGVAPSAAVVDPIEASIALIDEFAAALATLEI